MPTQKARASGDGPVLLLVAVRIHADPIDIRVGFHATSVERRCFLKSDVVIDRDSCDSTLPENAGEAGNRPDDLVLLVFHPIEMKGKIGSSG